MIELVQAIHAARGQIMKLNEAANWIVTSGYSRLDTRPKKSSQPSAQTAMPLKVNKTRNEAISIDLVPRLSEQGTHPIFIERGISAKTCRYLRCGYLQAERGVLSERLVFQVGGLAEDLKSRVILSHIGRATTKEQQTSGKWRYYRGFNPSRELYNLDNVVLDKNVARQISETGQLVLVEGAFDVAKCVEAGILNVVASFGARLSETQVKKLRDILPLLSASRVLVFYDRDRAGQCATKEAIALLRGQDIQATAFDWKQGFIDARKERIPITKTIQDPCDFSVKQLHWLRKRRAV